MLEMLRKRREDEDRGFTLIELMVVVLIIAILIAIAIPTFLGARKRAQDRAAQANLRSVLNAEKTFYTDSQEYTETEADLTDIEPSVKYEVADATLALAKENKVFVELGTDEQTVVLASKSEAGKCFYMKDIASGTGAGTYYGWADGDCASGQEANITATTTDGWKGAEMGGASPTTTV